MDTLQAVSLGERIYTIPEDADAGANDRRPTHTAHVLYRPSGAAGFTNDMDWGFQWDWKGERQPLGGGGTYEQQHWARRPTVWHWARPRLVVGGLATGVVLWTQGTFATAWAVAACLSAAVAAALTWGLPRLCHAVPCMPYWRRFNALLRTRVPVLQQPASRCAARVQRWVAPPVSGGICVSRTGLTTWAALTALLLLLLLVHPPAALGGVHSAAGNDSRSAHDLLVPYTRYGATLSSSDVAATAVARRVEEYLDSHPDVLCASALEVGEPWYHVVVRRPAGVVPFHHYLDVHLLLDMDTRALVHERTPYQHARHAVTLDETPTHCVFWTAAAIAGRAKWRCRWWWPFSAGCQKTPVADTTAIKRQTSRRTHVYATTRNWTHPVARRILAHGATAMCLQHYDDVYRGRIVCV